ncbi:MAG: hypothetical protein SFY67_00390 [Candidatus Melainabacteria bacterium]|nr:hypothetical protein [Candidatus Melainabacteria bacterium]
MSEEATKLDEKTANETVVEDVKTTDVISKPRSPERGMSNPLAFLILFSLPFGYMVSSLSGQYATHATFAMVALFIISSLMDQDKNSRYTGFLFAVLWSCAGVLFYNMRGI